MAEARVEHNEEHSRYELHVDGERRGLIDYRRRGDALAFLHTEVDEELEGQGLGGRLVAGALDDVRARGEKVVPLCSFVAAHIRRHPEYADLVAGD